MDKSTTHPTGPASQSRALLRRLGRTAMRAVQTVAFAATFTLLAGVLGAIVGKPIVALVVWVWSAMWPK